MPDASTIPPRPNSGSAARTWTDRPRHLVMPDYRDARRHAGVRRARPRAAGPMQRRCRSPHARHDETDDLCIRFIRYGSIRPSKGMPSPLHADGIRESPLMRVESQRPDTIKRRSPCTGLSTRTSSRGVAIARHDAKDRLRKLTARNRCAPVRHPCASAQKCC